MDGEEVHEGGRGPRGSALSKLRPTTCLKTHEHVEDEQGSFHHGGLITVTDTNFYHVRLVVGSIHSSLEMQ